MGIWKNLGMGGYRGFSRPAALPLRGGVRFFIYSTHFRYCPDSISSEKKYRQLS